MILSLGPDRLKFDMQYVRSHILAAYIFFILQQLIISLGNRREIDKNRIYIAMKVFLTETPYPNELDEFIQF